MTRTRASASLALTAAIAGSFLSSTVAAPMAHAETILGPIQGRVEGARAQSSCPALTYRGDLEAAAQGAARGGDASSGYPGEAKWFKSINDPTDTAAEGLVNLALGAIKDCKYKDFGVGMLRAGDDSIVTLVLGIPAPAPAPAPAPDPVVNPNPVVPKKEAPTDAVRVSFDRGPGLWTVNVRSTAEIPGACTYVATNPLLPGVNKSFDIAPFGSASLEVLAPPPLSTYHVVTSCKGTWEAQTIEFGHDEQDVSLGG